LDDEICEPAPIVCFSDLECQSDEMCNLETSECEWVNPMDYSIVYVDPITLFECSMDGYVDLVQSLMNILLAGFSIAK